MSIKAVLSLTLRTTFGLALITGLVTPASAQSTKSSPATAQAPKSEAAADIIRLLDQQRNKLDQPRWQLDQWWWWLGESWRRRLVKQPRRRRMDQSPGLD
jgi:hypothetical protein